MIKLSVIVPVYNVENYVSECIESIVSQTLKEIEIIVINDGCTDNSIENIKKIKDKRIMIVDKENGGLSSARNRGIKEAKGEYIIFIDSDDFLKYDNALEDIYNIAEEYQCDIVCGNALIYHDDTDKYPMKRSIEIKKSKILNPIDFLKKSMGFDWVPVPLYFYKTSFIKDNKLIFKEGIYHEDELFTPQAILKSNQIAIYDKEFYVYRQRDGSIMHTKSNTKKGYDIIENCLELEALFLSINDKELRDKLLERSVWIVFDNIYKYDLEYISNDVKKFVLRYSRTKSTIIRSNLLHINSRLYLKVDKIWRKIRG